MCSEWLEPLPCKSAVDTASIYILACRSLQCVLPGDLQFSNPFGVMQEKNWGQNNPQDWGVKFLCILCCVCHAVPVVAAAAAVVVVVVVVVVAVIVGVVVDVAVAVLAIANAGNCR